MESPDLTLQRYANSFFLCGYTNDDQCGVNNVYDDNDHDNDHNDDDEEEEGEEAEGGLGRNAKDLESGRALQANASYLTDRARDTKSTVVP